MRTSALEFCYRKEGIYFQLDNYILFLFNAAAVSEKVSEYRRDKVIQKQKEQKVDKGIASKQQQVLLCSILAKCSLVLNKVEAGLIINR